jgi:hypothetical protein
MSNLKDVVKLGGAAVGLGAVALFYYFVSDKVSKKQKTKPAFADEIDSRQQYPTTVEEQCPKTSREKEPILPVSLPDPEELSEKIENQSTRGEVEHVSKEEIPVKEIHQEHYTISEECGVVRRFISQHDMEIVRIPSLTDLIEDYSPDDQESDDENKDWILVDTNSTPSVSQPTE